MSSLNTALLPLNAFMLTIAEFSPGFASITCILKYGPLANIPFSPSAYNYIIMILSLTGLSNDRLNLLILSSIIRFNLSFLSSFSNLRTYVCRVSIKSSVPIGTSELYCCIFLFLRLLNSKLFLPLLLLF